MTLYLIHFDQPISADHTCQHYLGYTSDKLTARLTTHIKGRGARLTEVARERGIGWRLVRTWPGATRSDERYLKNRHHGNRLCPVCFPVTNRALALPSGWTRTRVRRPMLRFVAAFEKAS